MNIINQIKKRPVDGGNAHWTPAHRRAGALAVAPISVSPTARVLPSLTRGSLASKASASRLFLSSRLTSNAACQPMLVNVCASL